MSHTILLVDDNPHDVELTLLALEEGIAAEQVKVVNSGREAMEYLEARSPDKRPELILLDLNMPHMNGIEVLDAVRRAEHTRNIPVVMLTTSDAESDRQASYQHGADDYVVKNLDLAAFIESIRRAMQRVPGLRRASGFA